MNERYFEQSRGRSKVFWAVRIEGKKVITRSGAVGAFGSEAAKPCASPAEAKNVVAELAKKKASEGYTELNDAAVFLNGTGPKPMSMRVAVDASQVYVNGVNLPQTQLDLASLESLSKLTSLSIALHKLSSLDLSVLPKCRTLQEFSLSNSGLKTLDLAPLGACKKLVELSLAHLKTVDLSGLAESRSLKTLKVMNNDLRELDLAPLAKVKTLENLHLQFNPKLRSIDVTALRALKKLEIITVDQACEVVGEKECGVPVTRFD